MSATDLWSERSAAIRILHGTVVVKRAAVSWRFCRGYMTWEFLTL
jgi:hypothetical protein